MTEPAELSENVVPPRTYYAVYAALIVLTITTVGVSFLDLGAWHTMVGLAIAAAKVTLVALIFMHVWYGERIIWAALAAGLLWLAILLSFTLADYLTRTWLAL